MCITLCIIYIIYKSSPKIDSIIFDFICILIKRSVLAHYSQEPIDNTKSKIYTWRSSLFKWSWYKQSRLHELIEKQSPFSLPFYKQQFVHFQVPCSYWVLSMVEQHCIRPLSWPTTFRREIYQNRHWNEFHCDDYG